MIGLPRRARLIEWRGVNKTGSTEGNNRGEPAAGGTDDAEGRNERRLSPFVGSAPVKMLDANIHFFAL
jgi:hypothetical protein